VKCQGRWHLQAPQCTQKHYMKRQNKNSLKCHTLKCYKTLEMYIIWTGRHLSKTFKPSNANKVFCCGW